MRTLTFVANQLSLSKHGDFTGLVAGTRGYLQAQFTFSSDWSGYRKVAVFKCGDQEYSVLLTGNYCNVPDEVAACLSFKVYVVGRCGTSQMQSNSVTVVQRRY